MSLFRIHFVQSTKGFVDVLAETKVDAINDYELAVKAGEAFMDVTKFMVTEVIGMNEIQPSGHRFFTLESSPSA